MSSRPFAHNSRLRVSARPLSSDPSRRLKSSPLKRGGWLARSAFRSVAPLRKRSKKQARREREWSALKAVAIAERGDVCQVCGVAKAQHAHHRGGKLSQTLAMLLLVCGGCHQEIHANPAESRRRGWMVSRNEVSA